MKVWSICNASGCGVCLTCDRSKHLARGIMCCKDAINLANVFIMFSNDCQLDKEQIDYMAEWCEGDKLCLRHLKEYGFSELQIDEIEEVVRGLETETVFRN